MTRTLPALPECPGCGQVVFGGKPGERCRECQGGLDLTPKCPRCGKSVNDFAEIAKLASAALHSLRHRNITASAASVLQMIVEQAPCREGRCRRPL